MSGRSALGVLLWLVYGVMLGAWPVIVANAITLEAYISFLGLGVGAPTATWGNMLDGANNYLESAPWMWFFPGMLILLTVLSINFLGDGLRDALDPRLNR